MAAPKYIPIYRSTYEAARMMTNQQRLRFYDAIGDYGFDGTAPDFSDDKLLDVAFKMLRPYIDAFIARSNGGRKRAAKANARQAADQG